MAISIAKPKVDFVGLSTDTKPVTGDFGRGSTFQETNTSDVYELDGDSWVKIKTAGVDHVTLYSGGGPVDISGMTVVGVLSGTAAATTIQLPTGITGIILTNHPDTAAAYTLAQDATAFASFNYHPINDPTLLVDGLRYEIPPNGSVEVLFSGTPKPTEMYLAVPNATGRVSYRGGAS